MFNAEGSFARKQLEKQGWTEGAGLGSSQQGIIQAIKVKIKHDTTGVGHDPAKEFNDFWWERAYNKAAANLIVEKVEDGVVIRKRTTTKKERLEAAKNVLYGNFIKGSLLNNGTETAVEKESGDSDSSEDETAQQTPTFLLPDEELLRRCGGRTFHPAARHGMKLSGKLARIAEHDRLYMQKHQNSPSSPLAPQSSQNGATARSPCPPENLSETEQQKKRKRKERDDELYTERKDRGQVSASEEEPIQEQPEDTATVSKKKKKKKRERSENEGDITTESSSACPFADKDVSKSKNRKERDDSKERQTQEQLSQEQPEGAATVSKKKKKKKGKKENESDITTESSSVHPVADDVSRSKKGKERDDVCPAADVYVSKVKKRKNSKPDRAETETGEMCNESSLELQTISRGEEECSENVSKVKKHKKKSKNDRAETEMAEVCNDSSSELHTTMRGEDTCSDSSADILNGSVSHRPAEDHGSRKKSKKKKSKCVE